MRTFTCDCDTRVFFENVACLSCGRELGFLPAARVLSTLEPLADGSGYRALADGGIHRKCQNYLVESVCNWMVPESDPEAFCLSCRLDATIPDLSKPGNRELWAEVEVAKRRLIYNLLRLRLPIASRAESPQGLAFDILGSEPGNKILTGHADGLITINLAEADPLAREQARINLNERYRTVLGHMRHEIGHYYWTALIAGSPNIERFRELFGDERQDYGEALDRHYGAGVSGDWPQSVISAYAAAHPWEDWAETWAHYLHITDTLETAYQFGFTPVAPALAARNEGTFESLLDAWVDLTIALNALTRSMGQPDAYPFAISAHVAEKLRFVHGVIVGVATGK